MMNQNGPICCQFYGYVAHFKKGSRPALISSTNWNAIKMTKIFNWKETSKLVLRRQNYKTSMQNILAARFIGAVFGSVVGEGSLACHLAVLLVAIIKRKILSVCLRGRLELVERGGGFLGSGCCSDYHDRARPVPLRHGSVEWPLGSPAGEYAVGTRRRWFPYAEHPITRPVTSNWEISLILKIFFLPRPCIAAGSNRSTWRNLVWVELPFCRCTPIRVPWHRRHTYAVDGCTTTGYQMNPPNL